MQKRQVPAKIGCKKGSQGHSRSGDGGIKGRSRDGWLTGQLFCLLPSPTSASLRCSPSVPPRACPLSGMLTHELLNAATIFSSTAEPFTLPMDSNRNYRRVVPHKEAEFSSQSIMKAMEKFVQAVQEMDETILVPSRLMDLEVGDSEDTASLKSQSKKGSERDNLSSTDLFRLYNMVNCVKNELLWGANKGSPEDEESTVTTTTPPKTHARRPSIASLSSSQSLSDTDSETGNENDSGIEGESEAKPDYIHKMEESFKRHLYGLHRSLNHMAAAATYLTKRYQSDIGASV